MNKNLLLLLFMSFGTYTATKAQNQPTTTTPSTDLSSQSKPKKTNVIATLSYGAAFRTAKTPANLDPISKSLVEDIKSGSSFDANLYFLFRNRTSALGLKYNQFNATASYSGVELKDKIVYIGPSYMITAREGQPVGEFSLEMSLGYMRYTTEVPLTGFKITGASVGVAIGGGYHFRINEHILIGPSLNYLSATIREAEVTENGRTTTIKLEDDEAEGLGRIDLNLSAKFRF